MKQRVAIVTGICGGIGSAIGTALMSADWYVIGQDKKSGGEAFCDHFVGFDLATCADSQRFQSDCVGPIMGAVANRPVHALVNNAAVQHLSSLQDIKIDDWHETLLVNLTAPMLLSKAFADPLAAVRGCILNIGSVHSRATKPGFVAYATSKGALQGLTQALAVDMGPAVRVMCLAPAAIATPMLVAGFEGNDAGLAELADCHPARRIGTTEEVAKAALFLVDSGMDFLTGSTLYLDGGILSRLHDPA
jgi:meso-butanediol dehydrogenase / (S,S)-butanediol dehydrogenase / diacetyl reductase